MQISLIAAVAENYTIGRDGDLPWHLPSDLRWFVSHTKGKPIIFGRKTLDSLGEPLPSRRNIILTRQEDWSMEGCDVAHSIEDALEMATEPGDVEEVMILGGGHVYEQFMDRADRFYLTVVHEQFEGDAHFPAFDMDQWEIRARRRVEADDDNPHDHTFYVLDRLEYGPAANPSEGTIPAELRKRTLV
jgi:dihydrofolate reductase